MRSPGHTFSPTAQGVLLFLGALLPVFGVWGSPTGLLPGTELGDVYKHAWSFWHTPHALSTWPWTEALNAPSGGRLWDVMLMPSLILSPLTALLGPVFSANVWVVASLLAIGVSTRALALETGSDAGRATVAGFVAQGAPYLYGYPLYSGVHERLGIWLFPFLLLCALRLRGGGSLKWALWGVVAFAFVASGCGVYGIWAVLLLGLATPFLWRRGAGWAGSRGVVTLGLGIGVVSVALLLAMKAASGSSSLSPQPDRFGVFGIPWGMDFSSATMSSLLFPWEVRSTVPVDSGDVLLELSYLGIVPLGLCLMGLRDARTRWICSAALFFAVLALGPGVEWGGRTFINPVYVAVAWVLPTYGSVPVPFQQVGVFAGLASVGVVAVVASSRSREALLLVALVLASIVERALVLPTGLILETAPASVSEVYEVVDGGSVVEMPRDYRNRALSPTRSFLAQTSHEQGLPLSISTGVTRWDAFLPIRTGVSESWDRDLRCMARGGFVWLVVDRTAYLKPEIASEAISGIEDVLGGPVASDGRWAVFSLNALGVAPSEQRFFPPFQPLVGMDNGGQGPPQADRGPSTPMGTYSGREAALCPL